MLGDVARYYSDKLAEHGATSKGVDWNDTASQHLRFDRLLYAIDHQGLGSILDFGCGFGSLWPFLKERGFEGSYTGFDISESMIAKAIELHGDQGVNWLTALPEGASFDYVVSSGIFNVKLKHETERWRDYVLKIVNEMNALSREGFVFNALTSYSDERYQRPDLYYMDPVAMFQYCKREYTPFVVLDHGYPLYEFTLAVLKEEKWK